MSWLEQIAHRGKPAADLVPQPPRLPREVPSDEVRNAVSARPPWEDQWFEVDGETAATYKLGDYFQGGTIEQITAARYPKSRYFIHVINRQESASK